MKVKYKVFPCFHHHHIMRVHGRIGGIVPFSLNFRTRQRWVVSLTNQPFYSWWKNSRYPLNGRPGGSQNKFGHRKKISGPFQKLNTQFVSPAASHLALYWLRYSRSWRNKRTCTQVIIWHALHAFKKKIMQLCRTMVIIISGHLAII